MKLTKYIASVVLIVLSISSYAQQTPQYTQYMFNDFIINPAIAGTHDYYQIRTTNRFQWVGLKDAPITNTLSVYGPHKSLPMGWGGYVLSDNTGPTSKIGVYGAYGYHINIMRDMQLSFGLSLGFIQYGINIKKILFEKQDDYIEQNKYTYMKPDAVIGVYLYTARYFGGFSVDQLFNSKVVVYEDDTAATTTTFNRLKSHFTLVGGYKFNINRDFDMEPSLLFRATGKSMPQAEITAKAIYQKMAWLALSFRTSDAIAVLAGYNYKDKIYIGYSYDITYSRIRVKSGGSHEIMIGARFNKVRTSAGGKL